MPSGVFSHRDARRAHASPLRGLPPSVKPPIRAAREAPTVKYDSASLRSKPLLETAPRRPRYESWLEVRVDPVSLR